MGASRIPRRPRAATGPAGSPQAHSDRRARALVAVVLAIALVLAIAATTLAWHAYESAKRDENRRIGTAAVASADDAAQFVQGRIQILTALASSDAFVDGDRAGITARIARLDPDALALSRGVTWFDEQGVARAANGSGLAEGAQATGALAAALQEVRMGGRALVTGPLEDSIYGRSIVAVAVPTDARAGGAKGVLVGAIGVDWLNQVALSRREVRGGDTLITDRTGALFVAPGLASARDASAQPVMGRVVEAGRGVVTGLPDPAGVSGSVIGFARDDAVTGWTLFVERPTREAYAAPLRTFRVELVALAILTLLGVVTVLMAARGLGRERRATEDAEARTRRLQEMTAALAVAATAEDVARAVLELGQGATGAAAGSIALLDRERETLTTLALIGYSDDIGAAFPTYPAAAGLPIPDAIREGPVWLSDAAAVGERYPHLAGFHASMAHEAVASLPLSVDGAPFGGITLSFPDARRFPEDERAYLMTIADLCAQALERARLYEAELRDAERQAFLGEAGVILATRLEPAAALSALAALAVPRMADWCSVSILGEAGIDTVAVAHVDPEKVALAEDYTRRFPPSLEDETGVAAVLRTGRPEFVPVVTDALIDAAVPPGERRDIIRRLGLVSGMTVPLSARGRTLGALVLASSDPARHFTPDDLGFALDLGARAGLALDNALLTERAREIARRLQEGLLPASIPPIEGLDIATRYVAGGEDVDVGGDFYDLFALEDGNGWAATLGDVCGKGLDAAALTALARHTIRAEADLLRPGAVLGRLNRAVLRNDDEMRFLTAVYAWLRRAGDGIDVVLARGGHPPAVVLRRAGDVEAHLPDGPLIGIVPDASFAELELHLEPGDALVFFSDGIVEARAPDGSLFGMERLRGVLAEAAGATAEGLTSVIERAVDRFQGEQARDDRALLVVRVTELPEGVPEA